MPGIKAGEASEQHPLTAALEGALERQTMRLPTGAYGDPHRRTRRAAQAAT
jgi:hypothetical protein